ncbi:hypothetical protein QWZ03_03275 [Chitinimonas viridis]|uniref:Type 4 fimbrial biogenesis protein PilX N-terminal domain-containing protein n=1 Tax=Chitinimonas viridis TaxID=664880 RepID=A0ABT8B198_9NEIS|nr:hypothetical protein [Chitinimonas viridis]MDN3575790.1 hypothetical protein [Chitinimonas viridis]
MIPMYSYSAGPVPGMARQRGVVLLISLIALVALTLAGLAIVRQVDTATLVTGNLTFRQSSINTADLAVEHMADISSSGGFGILNTVETRYHNNYGGWYRSTLFTEENPTSPCVATDLNCIKTSGIPNALRAAGKCKSSSDAAASALRAVWDEASGNCAVMVLERMCRNTGQASANHCVLFNQAQVGGKWTQGQTGDGTNSSDIVPPQNGVGMRLSVRVDGPRGTTSYLQTILIYPLPDT